MTVRKSNNSKPSDWVGKCNTCEIWRTREHTIIDQKTQRRYCVFDGGLIHKACEKCNRSGRSRGNFRKRGLGLMNCLHCGGTGMQPKGENYIKRVIQ